MGSIKWKMALLYMLLAVTIMLSCGVGILFVLRRNAYKEVYQQSEYTAERVVDMFTVRTFGKDDSPATVFAQILTSLMIENVNSVSASSGGEQVYLLDSEGQLVYAREATLTTGDLANRAIVEARSGQSMSEIYVHDTYQGEPVGDFAMRFTLPQDGEDYIIFVRQSMKGVQESLRNLTLMITLITSVGIVVAGVMGYMLAVSVSKPIKRLTQKSKDLASGHLEAAAAASSTLKPRENDELGQLEVNFDEMAAELSRSILELQAMEKMQKEFVANVSHELRTPITTIKSYVDTLLESGLDDPELSRRFLTVVSHESDRMTALITDLLELSKMDAHQVQLVKQPLEMGSVMESCLNDLSWDAGKKQQSIEWAKDIPVEAVSCADDSLPRPENEYWILGEERRIEQVIRNLLTNAIKYSPEGTVIYGGVYEHEKEDGSAEIWLCVKDSGIGISEEDQKHIFDRFYRVDKARSRSMGGTGLGLAIVKETVEMYDGRVWVDSAPGKGSTFWVAFPEMEEAEEDTEEEELGQEAVEEALLEEKSASPGKEPAVQKEVRE